MKPLQSWRSRLALALAIFDAVWAFSALKLGPGANEAATVGMINSVIWVFLHLPAALLASLPYDKSGALPASQLVLMGVLGVLQMAALGWWLGKRMDKKA